MATVPRGGASTINGILYQMLSALARVGCLATHQRRDDGSGLPLEVTLILEPTDGGDQQQLSPGHRVVEQLKSRSDQGTWSLQQIVTEVLPDLYRAVDLTRPNTEYRFVTEGRMGGWTAPYDFFRSLEKRAPTDGILNGLDDSKEIRFRRVTKQNDQRVRLFWGTDKYTEHRLFEHIVAHLRSVSTDDTEPLHVMRQKAWHLLAHFVFDGRHTADNLQKSVDACLAGIVPAIDDLPTIRDALLLDLARRATVGSAQIVASSFLQEHHLNATPLSHWRELTNKATKHFHSKTALQKIDLREEARPAFVEAAVNRWATGCPLLVLSGESGQGKTWLGYSLLREALRREEVVMAIEARGDADRDRQAAAGVFWHEIVGQDTIFPLERVCQRLRQVRSGQEGRRVTLLVDGVHDQTEATRLACSPWEDWGVRVIITCLPSVADTIVGATPKERVTHVPVPNFTVTELQDYLSSAIGDHWASIPQDVQNTLRRPLLAQIYRDLAQDGVWQPRREYEFYERVWNRILQSASPCDGVALADASRSLLDQEPYPWSVSQLVGTGMDNDAITRLLRLGWLTSSAPGYYKIWHDRLLNWAVAEGIVAAVRDGRLDEATALHKLQALHRTPSDSARPFLGYVIMDVLWIASDGMNGFTTRILPILERHP